MAQNCGFSLILHPIVQFDLRGLFVAFETLGDLTQELPDHT
jgi:hypothetical protein